MNSWIQTYSGVHFDPLNPKIEDINIEDIAHALSLICRFNGHCKRFYSVAEHSLYVCEQCAPKARLAGLLHDAAEAYLCDLVRPIKREFKQYEMYEANLLEMIFKRFNVKYDTAIQLTVKKWDNTILSCELKALMHHDAGNWGPTTQPEPIPTIVAKIEENSFRDVEGSFLWMFQEQLNADQRKQGNYYPK